MRAALRCVVLVALACAPVSVVAQETLQGFALVIGQSAYEDSSGLRALRNPENDALELRGLMRDLGFDVAPPVIDADAEDLREVLDEFAEDAAGADVALVYYSGHGIEAGGHSYLIPVDADMSSAEAAGRSLVPLQTLLDELRRTVKVTIVLFDACRTNSFAQGQAILLPGQSTPIEVTAEGLAPDAATSRGVVLAATNEGGESLGAVIGFASSPGQAALDGEGENSPYAAALIKHLGAGGYELGDVMTMVAREVYVETDARQLPWVNSSLTGFISVSPSGAGGDPDEALIAEGRRTLLLSIDDTPPATRDFVEATADAEGVPLDELYGMLGVLGVDLSGDPTQLEAELQQGAVRLREMLEEAPGAAKTDVELVRLSELADRAQAEGAIAAALEFRQRASDRAGELEVIVDANEAGVREDRLQIAETYADHAQTAELSFDFATEAEMLGKAFAQVERWDAGLARDYQWEQGRALADLGEYTGATEPLQQAIALYDAAKAATEEGSGDWASIENDRGNALLILGARVADPALLEQAVAAFRAVLDLRSAAGLVHDWAGTQSNLGVALMNLGEREPAPDTLLASAEAFDAALAQMDRGTQPFDWATTMSNLGNVLLMLGDREGDPSRYQAAAEAHTAALEELTRERAPLAWAKVQNNLGQALARLGEREEGNENLEAAIAAFRLALEERDRNRVPVDWGVSQDSLGSALATLGNKTGDARLIKEGIAAFRAALEVDNRETAPLSWGWTQRNLAIALKTLGVGLDDIGLLREAADAYRAAISAFDPELVPLDWAQTNGTLGIALMEIAAREPTEEVLLEARDAFASALVVYEQYDVDMAGYLIGRIEEIDGALGQ